MFDPQAIIAEATAEAPKAEANAPEQEAQATSEEAQATEPSQETTQDSEDVSKKPDSELTPEQLAKREANRISHEKSKLAKEKQKLREKNRELESRLKQLEQSLNQPKQQAKPDGKPDITQFDDHMEYLEALADWKLETKLKAANEQKPQAPQVDERKLQRNQEIEQQRNALVKQAPEYQSMVAENSWYLNSMPETVQEAFYEADNAPLALYALMKEGRLEDLEDLSPARIAMEIGRAEERGKAYLGAAKTISTAPPPIESLKGTGRASKSLDSMSVEELMKKFNR